MNEENKKPYFDVKSICIGMEGYEFTVTEFINNPRVYYQLSDDKAKLVAQDEPFVFRLTKGCKVAIDGKKIGNEGWIEDFDSEFTVMIRSNIDIKLGTVSIGTISLEYRHLAPVVDDFYKELFQSASVRDIDMTLNYPAQLNNKTGLKVSDDQKKRVDIVKVESD